MKRATLALLLVPFLSATLLFLTLYIWRIAYPWSDWASLGFIPLTLILFFGHMVHSVEIYRARLHTAIRVESSLSSILTGNIWAILRTFTLLLVAIPLMAWQALVSEIHETITLFVLCLFSGGLFSFLKLRISSHFHNPFSDMFAISSGTWIIAIIFIPIIAWMNFGYTSHAGENLTADLTEAVMLRLKDLPLRQSSIAEILAPMYAYEAAKLWIVVQLGESKWAVVLFSLDTALISFIFARVSIVLNLTIQRIIR
jgi:hypothetical protein